MENYKGEDMKTLTKAEIQPLVINLIDSIGKGEMKKVVVVQLYGIGATKIVLDRIIVLITDLIETFSDGIQITDVSYLFSHLDDLIDIGKNYNEAVKECKELNYEEQEELIKFIVSKLIELFKPLKSTSGNLYDVQNINIFIWDLKALIQKGIYIFKDGLQLRDIAEFIKLAGIMTTLAFNFKNVMNEIKDLNDDELNKVIAAMTEMIYGILAE